MPEDVEFGGRFVGVAAGLGGRFAAFGDHFAVEVFDPEGPYGDRAGAARAERQDKAAAAARAPRKRRNDADMRGFLTWLYSIPDRPCPRHPRAVGPFRLAGDRYVLKLALLMRKTRRPRRGRRVFDHRMLCRCCGLGGRPPAPPYLLFFLPLHRLFFSTGFSVVLRPF